MKAKCKTLFSTGIYVPTEKHSLFMVAFEAKLISDFNVVPEFGSVSTGNSCEVKLNYLRSKSYKPGSLSSDINKAVEFLKSNMHVLTPMKSANRRKSLRPRKYVQISPQIIDLVDEEEEGKAVDHRNTASDEPEVIILDESTSQTRRNNISSQIVDLSESSWVANDPGTSRDTDSEITVLHECITIPKTPLLKKHVTNGKAKIVNSLSQSLSSINLQEKKINVKLKNKLKNKKLTSQISSSTISTLPKKRSKSGHMSNNDSASFCSASPSSQLPGLSENAVKYYKNIAKMAGKANLKNCNYNANFIPVTQRNMKKISPRNETRNKTSLKVLCEANRKRKVFTPQCSSTTSNNPRPLHKKLMSIENSPCRKLRGKFRNTLSGVSNSFNPHPHEVELEGLRPIVIDGCNVAIGHGKGSFSAKALDICVDFFTSRGHTNIKIFLPQFREEQIPKELLTILQSKCDVIFTPSQCINGQRRTPYDDRFIVQYATEFGGVIVSTDNYRDISRENPRWQDTIAKRLLMFTWVDDFLMFPVDPLGRSGPTLDKFLSFS